MNIKRVTLSILFIASIVYTGQSLPVLDESLKGVADHAAASFGKELEKAGKEITKTLPTTINVDIPSKQLFSAFISIAGVAFLYNGISKALSTLEKTNEELTRNNQDRTRLYKAAACNIGFGLLSLAASFAVLNWK